MRLLAPRLTGAARLAAGRDAVRAVLAEPERIGAALPGVEEITAGEDGGFAARVVPRLGIGPVPFSTRWTPAARDDGRQLGWSVRGTNGESELHLRIELELGDADPGTDLSWSMAVYATGMLRSVGQRTLGMVIAAQVEDVLAAVDALAADLAARP